MEWIPIVLVVFKGSVLITGMFFAIKWHYDQDRKTDISDPLASAEIRLFAAMIIAIAASLIGIVYAGCWGNPANGGLGGALGCAFTFLMAFMSKPNTDAIFNLHIEQASPVRSEVPGEPDPRTQSDHLDQLASVTSQSEQARSAFLSMLNLMEREKAYLGIASVISTLAWKFGETAAAALKF